MFKGNCLPDALGPHELVEAGVYAHVGRSHLLLRELLDLLDRARCTLLEAAKGDQRLSGHTTREPLTCRG